MHKKEMMAVVYYLHVWRHYLLEGKFLDTLICKEPCEVLVIKFFVVLLGTILEEMKLELKDDL